MSYAKEHNLVSPVYHWVEKRRVNGDLTHGACGHSFKPSEWNDAPDSRFVCLGCTAKLKQHKAKEDQA